jgi:hypothetical protein
MRAIIISAITPPAITILQRQTRTSGCFIVANNTSQAVSFADFFISQSTRSTGFIS